MRTGLWIRLVSPDGSEDSLPLEVGAIGIGRAEDNGIVLSTDDVSSHHAQLLCDERSCRVLNLVGGESVLVNGQAVPQNLTRRLHEGDILDIGTYRMYLVMPNPADTRQAPREGKVRGAMMKNATRQQTLLLWVIGALGALVAIGLIGIVVWFVFFRPTDPTPAVGVPSATMVTVALTETPAGVTEQPPTSEAQATPTATATQPLAATATTQWATAAPTFTLAPVSVTPAATLPAATPVPPTLPPLSTTIPSPYGTVSGQSANVRGGPSTQYAVLATMVYGQQVLLQGKDSSGGWVYIQMPDGRFGWTAAYLVNYSAALALPVLPAPPQASVPTPSYWTPLPPTPPVVGWTPIPTIPYTPVWTPVPPTPPVVWTPIPFPTATFTPLPAPPTSTPTPACPVAIGSPFVAAWQSGDTRSSLGCPTEGMAETWTAIQRFERGVMFWRQDQDMIYVVATDGSWRKVTDSWVEGSPEYSCSDVPPAGLTAPKRGFGNVWCNQSGMKSLIGWGIEDERGFTTQFQAFQNGEMMRAEDGTIYVLLRSGWWRRYP